MNRKSSLAALAVFSAFILSAASLQAGEETRTADVQIKGAVCPVGCGTAITKAIREYPSVVSLDLDKKNWIAHVTLKPDADPAELVKYFNEHTRYSAQLVQQPEGAHDGAEH